jgi:Flp pilus assembly protein TadG
MMRRKHQNNNQRGSVFVEFALSALVLVSLFTGTFQFGYTFFVYNSLVTAVSAATRYASLHALTNDNNQTVPASFSNDVKNMAVYGTTTPSSSQTPIAPGLATSNINVAVRFVGASGSPTNRPVDVTVSVTGYQVNAIFKTFTFTGKPASTIPYFGSYCSEVATCP